MSNKIKLAVFCSSNFEDYEFLCEILNKKIDEIGLIISNNSGHKLPERYAFEKNIPLLSYPIGKNLNVLRTNDLMIAASTNVVIFDDGQSDNNEVVRKKCVGANKPHKVIQIPEGINCQKVCDLLEEIYHQYEASNDSQTKAFVEWLGNHKRIGNRLTKIIREL
jgi:hypothetical protein